MRTAATLALLVLGLLAPAPPPVLAGAQPRKEVTIPEKAKGFAGLVVGRVVQSDGDRVLIQVIRVRQAAKSSKARDPSALTGLTLELRPGGKRPGVNDPHVAKYLSHLKVGQQTDFEVAHRDGNSLVMVELTRDQKESLK